MTSSVSPRPGMSSSPEEKNPADSKKTAFEADVEKVYQQVYRGNEYASMLGSVSSPAQAFQYDEKGGVLKKASDEFKKLDLSKAFTDSKGVPFKEDDLKPVGKKVTDTLAILSGQIDKSLSQQFSSWMVGEKFDQIKWDEKSKDLKALVATEFARLKDDLTKTELKAQDLPPIPVHKGVTSGIVPGTDAAAAEEKRYKQEVENYQKIQIKNEESKKKLADLDKLQKEKVAELDKLSSDALFQEMKRLANSLKNKLEIDAANVWASRVDNKILTDPWYKFGEDPGVSEGVKLSGCNWKLEDGEYKSNNPALGAYTFIVKDNAISTSPPPSQSDFVAVYDEIFQKLITGKGAQGITLEYDKGHAITDHEMDNIEKLISLAETKYRIPIKLGPNLMDRMQKRLPSLGAALLQDVTSLIPFVDTRKAGQNDQVRRILARVSNLKTHRSLGIPDAAAAAKIKQSEAALDTLAYEAVANSDIAKTPNSSTDPKEGEAWLKKFRGEFEEYISSEKKGEVDLDQMNFQTDSVLASVERLNEIRQLIDQSTISILHDVGGDAIISTLVERQQNNLENMVNSMALRVKELEQKVEALADAKLTTTGDPEELTQATAKRAEAKAGFDQLKMQFAETSTNAKKAMRESVPIPELNEARKNAAMLLSNDKPLQEEKTDTPKPR